MINENHAPYRILEKKSGIYLKIDCDLIVISWKYLLQERKDRAMTLTPKFISPRGYLALVKCRDNKDVDQTQILLEGMKSTF